MDDGNAASLSEEKLERRFADIPVELIRPNPSQPRQYFDEAELEELAASIAEVGVIQPVVLIPSDSGYEIVVGERRLRAAKKAGLSSIPAVIMNAAPREQQVMALIENIHRSNLSAIEEAMSLRDILESTGWSQTELASRLGRSQSSVANKLRLLKLEEPVQSLVLQGKLGERQARALIALAGEEQIAMARAAVEENLVADSLEKRIKGEKSPARTFPSPTAARKKETLSFTGPDGPTGEILKDIAELVEKSRRKGIPVVWKVKELAQRELVLELVVDLKGSVSSEEERS
jgi:ParB family chromosome partitioning protein